MSKKVSYVSRNIVLNNLLPVFSWKLVLNIIASRDNFALSSLSKDGSNCKCRELSWATNQVKQKSFFSFKLFLELYSRVLRKLVVTKVTKCSRQSCVVKQDWLKLNTRKIATSIESLIKGKATMLFGFDRLVFHLNYF